MRRSKNILLILIAAILLFAAFGFGGRRPARIVEVATKYFGCPTFDYSGIVITKAACEQSNGSITGIKVVSTGTKVNYTWYNASNTAIGHAIDLKNIPSGTYYVEVTDNSGCVSPIFSRKIFVDNANAVRISEVDAKTTEATCGGSITGITVAGATNYDWYDTGTNTIISSSTTSPNLNGVQAGTYQLRAFNNTCEATSKVYAISAQVQVPKVVTSTLSDPDCGGNDGDITVTLNVQAGLPKLTFYLTDETGQHLYDGIVPGGNPNPVWDFPKLDGGTFSLYVEDANHCSFLLGKYVLNDGTPSISKSQSIVTNDRCNQQLGSIVPIFINLGTTSRAFTYTWTDLSTGTVIGKNKVLTRIGAGVYRLRVSAGSAECTAVDTFTVINVSPSVIPPIAAGNTICLPGIINITVSNPDTAAIFRLYDSPTSTTPIDTNKTGIFYRQVDQTTDFYVTRVHKDCESDRTKVTETVVVSIKIPNAFTPNGDGVNDTWNIAGIDKFPGADIKIFTRYGQLIFHSINYPVAFNGTYNGSPLPTGAYYYIMDVKQPICYAKISGSLTIIR